MLALIRIIAIIILTVISIGAGAWGLINILDSYNFVDNKTAKELRSFGIKCFSVGLILFVITAFLNYFI